MFKKVNNEKIDSEDVVNVKICGNTTTITKVQCKNRVARIKKISKDEYVDLKTGEVKEFNHKKNRVNKLSAKRSMSKLKDIINTNITDRKKCRFLTLTYKENMTDKVTLQNDFKAFIKKLNSKKNKIKFHYNNIEYIAIYEPQGRGAFHIHTFLIFDTDNVFIPNTEISKIWENGHTKTQKIKSSITNCAEYFDSIITDMSVWEVKQSELSLKNLPTPKIKNIYGTRGGVKTKKFIKGARYELLKNYSHLYSCSKGIKKPDVIKDIEYKVAKEFIIGDVNKKATDSQTLTIYDDETNKYLNKITREIYDNN